VSGRALPALVLAGLGLAGFTLAAVLVDPGKALFAWLAAVAFWAGIPVGGLALLLVMRVLPGAWSAPLAPHAAALAALLPLVAVAGLPVALDLGALYPWVRAPLDTPFRSAWLAPAFWFARSGLFLAAGTAIALVLAKPGRRPLAIAALLVFVPLHTVIAFDWLMSLDPDFHSSGFGLWMLSGQGLSALAVIALLRLAEGPRGPDPLGALLLTMLLLWAYAAFMPFFIAWSGNLPSNAAWYGRRTEGSWAVVFPAVALLHAVPTLLLLFRRFRASPRALRAFAALVLVGQALQGAWLVLPEGPGGLLPPLVFLAGLSATGRLGIAVLGRRDPAVTP
jgi:hypothetical protein